METLARRISADLSPFTGSSNDKTQSVDVHAASGHIYAAGFVFGATANIAGVKVTRVDSGMGSLYIVKLNPDFSVNWVTIFNTTRINCPTPISVDQSTEIQYVGFQHSGSSTPLGNTTIGNNMVTMSVDSSGNLLAVQELDYISSSVREGANAMCADSVGNVWTGGYRTATDQIYVLGVPHTSWGSQEAFSVLYDTSLNYLEVPV